MFYEILQISLEKLKCAFLVKYSLTGVTCVPVIPAETLLIAIECIVQFPLNHASTDFSATAALFAYLVKLSMTTTSSASAARLAETLGVTKLWTIFWTVYSGFFTYNLRKFFRL